MTISKNVYHHKNDLIMFYSHMYFKFSIDNEISFELPNPTDDTASLVRFLDTNIFDVPDQENLVQSCKQQHLQYLPDLWKLPGTALLSVL